MSWTRRHIWNIWVVVVQPQLLVSSSKQINALIMCIGIMDGVFKSEAKNRKHGQFQTNICKWTCFLLVNSQPPKNRTVKSNWKSGEIHVRSFLITVSLWHPYGKVAPENGCKMARKAWEDMDSSIMMSSWKSDTPIYGHLGNHNEQQFTSGFALCTISSIKPIWDAQPYWEWNKVTCWYLTWSHLCLRQRFVL